MRLPWQGKEFRLCIYYRTNVISKNDYTLIGKDFWSFVGGDTATESVVFEIVKDTGKKFSFINLIQKRTEILWEHPLLEET